VQIEGVLSNGDRFTALDRKPDHRHIHGRELLGRHFAFDDHHTRHRATGGLGRGVPGKLDDLGQLMIHRQYQAMDWQDRVWAERASGSTL